VRRGKKKNLQVCFNENWEGVFQGRREEKAEIPVTESLRFIVMEVEECH